MMSISKADTIDLPAPGRWTWNDETQGLEFSCFNAADDAKDKRKKRALQEETIKRQERPPRDISCQQSSSSRERRKTGAAVRTALFVARLKRAVRTQVTIHNVKQVALNLMEENEAIAIPHYFLSLMKCGELDEFLGALLLYLSCYFEKKAYESKSKPLMAEPSRTEKRLMAEACMKVDLTQKQLALRYSSLILGLGRSHKHHHMACGRSKVSWTHRDRQLYEVLYRFLCYVAWVTFNRKDMPGIQEEVSRLLRSDTFNPTLKLKNPQSTQGEAETKTQESQKPSVAQRKSKRRPALSKIVNQRSPVMVSLLPTPQEDAPHLFQRALPCEPSSAELVNVEKLVAQLNQQLTSFNFGILGKPLAHFSPNTLMETARENEDNGDANSSASSSNTSPSIVRSKAIADSRSRANTATTRATTEGPSSDTD